MAMFLWKLTRKHLQLLLGSGAPHLPGQKRTGFSIHSLECGEILVQTPLANGQFSTPYPSVLSCVWPVYPLSRRVRTGVGRTISVCCKKLRLKAGVAI